MSDLISRDALVGYIEEQIEDSKEERGAVKKREEASSIYFYSGEISALKRMKRNIDMFAPAVDAVPVVRCRECKHCAVCGDGLHVCKAYDRHLLRTTPDGFCNRGAKMDGGAEG